MATISTYAALATKAEGGLLLPNTIHRLHAEITQALWSPWTRATANELGWRLEQTCTVCR